MNEIAERTKDRTKKFAIRIIKLYQNLPKNDEARIIGKQLIRSATSVAANYRAVCRARSDAEFFSKISIVVEEADECVFWIELIIETEIMKAERVKDLLNEANEILAIMSSSRKTVRNKLEINKSINQ